MKELLQYIKTLLIENECVIIPDFGGFITYYSPAQHLDEGHLFLPPYRTVGFNPLLQMNDGLLIQAYMQAHEVSYPVAQQMMETAVNELCDTLNKEGHIDIKGLGTLALNIENTLDFRPEKTNITAPSLYGWNKFEMKELKELQTSTVIHDRPQIVPKQPKTPNTLVINVNRTWLNNIVAVAAAVVLFFILSTPVSNTYVEPESYASLGYAGWFEQIRKESLATTLLESPQTPVEKKQQQKKIQEEKIKLVSTQRTAPRSGSQPKQTPAVTSRKKEIVPQPEKKTTPAPTKVSPKAAVSKQYHIIVASVGNRKDAETVIKELAGKGYPDATIIERDGRVRIALISGSDKESLNAQMLQLRKKEEFKNAWMLTTRN